MRRRAYDPRHGQAGVCLHPGVAEERHALHRRDVGSRWPNTSASDGDGVEVRRAVRCDAAGLVRRYELIVDAIAREKAIKKWPRAWKIKLIEENNPNWHDITWHLM